MTPRPELTDVDVEELLGAYALDACEPEETRRSKPSSRGAPTSREARGCRAPQRGSVLPRRSSRHRRLRGNVLGTARTRHAGGRDDPAIDLYRTQSERFEDAVDLVPDTALDATTTNGLSAHDLVIHEAAQESLIAQAVGDTPVPDISETNIEGRTAAFVDKLDGRPLDDAIELWRASVDANCAWANGPAENTANWRGLRARPQRRDRPPRLRDVDPHRRPPSCWSDSWVRRRSRSTSR